MARTSWTDLSGSHVYHTGSEQAYDDVINMAFRQSTEYQPRVIKTYRCHSIVVHNTTANQLIIVAFVSYGWWAASNNLCTLRVDHMDHCSANT